MSLYVFEYTAYFCCSVRVTKRGHTEDPVSLLCLASGCQTDRFWRCRCSLCSHFTTWGTYVASLVDMISPSEQILHWQAVIPQTPSNLRCSFSFDSPFCLRCDLSLDFSFCCCWWLETTNWASPMGWALIPPCRSNQFCLCTQGEIRLNLFCFLICNKHLK